MNREWDISFCVRQIEWWENAKRENPHLADVIDKDINEIKDWLYKKYLYVYQSETPAMAGGQCLLFG